MSHLPSRPQPCPRRSRIRSIPLPALYRRGSVGNLFLYYDFVLCAGMGGPRGFAFDYNHHPVAATDERLRLFLFLCYRSDEDDVKRHFCSSGASSPVGALKAAKFVMLKVDDLMNWARCSSIWPMTFGLACCIVEMMHTGTALTSFLGPAPANLIIVSTLTNNMAPALDKYSLYPFSRALISCIISSLDDKKNLANCQ
ncbi:NADH dehydrogenase [ubiquinone] iron-sulfur protein 7, mitochondrial [Glycine soja]